MPNEKWTVYKNHETGILFDITDADAQGKLTAILDGTTIDSFSNVESALADKVDVVAGKGLSTNDYDDTEKAKVAGAFPRSEQAVLGAWNQFRFKARQGTGTLTGTEDNFNLSGTGTYRSAEFTMQVEPNTRYITRFDVEVNQNLCFANAYDVTNSVTLVTGRTVTEDTNNYEFEFVTGATTKTIRMGIFCTSGTSATGDITVKNLFFGFDSDNNGYIPPAMTNKELTEKQILTAYIEDTTTASSNLVTTLDVAEYEILCAYGASLLAMPYFYFDSGQSKNFWCFHVTDNALQNVASTNVKIYYSYIKK